MNGLLYVSGEHVPLPPIFYFTLWGSIRDEWNAGTYALSLLVAVFSLLWPFIKLTLQLLLWWLPPSALGPKAHGLALRLVDATCKFAFTNIQMVVLLMVALHFKIIAPSAGPNASIPLLDVTVEVTPDVGTFVFCVAMLLSLLLGHWHAYRHRVLLAPLRPPSAASLALAPAVSTPPPDAQKPFSATARPLPLRRVAFDSMLCYERRRLPCCLQLLVALGLAGCVVGVAYGLMVDVIELELVGVVGALLGDERTTRWSVFSLAAAISRVTALADPLWLAILQAGFYLTVIAMPLAWPLVALALWMLPLRASTSARLLTVVEVATAWAMLDVFVVIMLTSLLSLDQFAQYTLSDDPTVVALNTALSSHAELRTLVPGEPVVLGVQPTLLPCYWLLLGAALAAVPLCVFVAHAANHAVEQQQAKRKAGVQQRVARQILMGLLAARV